MNFLNIDEEGFVFFGENKVKDNDVGQQALSSLIKDENGSWSTTINEEKYLVEAFDEPIVARHFVIEDGKYFVTGLYETKFEIPLEKLSFDEWDRIHGHTLEKISFVFSRSAQSDFFSLLTEFDDDSFTVRGKTYPNQEWLGHNPEITEAKFWTDVYTIENPGWELLQPANALIDMLPRLKLPKSRILIFGCGTGEDAAYLAENGHLVTAVDISEFAINKAKEKFPNLKNIEWICEDVFKFAKGKHQVFDIIFEHTFYCAIPPKRRNELVKVWIQLLVPTGHLMGVFFAMDKRVGPPFGGSEWEIRERLKKSYQFLFWGRWRQSVPRRQGRELFIYAQKSAEGHSLKTLAR